MARAKPDARTAGDPRAHRALETYRAKRDFAKTPEPAGASLQPGRRLVVQHHYATRDHYDLRLEVDGVLKSWAVTRGPSANPKDKRLAVRTEDHPLDYGTFEGLIPKGQYGGGTVILWEFASYEPLNGDPAAAIDKGEIKFLARGERMRGRWALVRMNTQEKRENWLLIKERDEFVEPDDGLVARFPDSVSTGRSRAEIEAGAPAKIVTTPRKSRGKAYKAAPSASDAQAPAFVEPMLCETADAPPAGADWLHEMKYDGYRLQVAADGAAVALRTRNGLDWTQRFPAIAEAARALKRRAVIDGEAVVLDARGLSDFPALVAALEQGRTARIELMAFDLLALDGSDLRKRPLEERKRKLESLLADAKGAIRYAAHSQGQGPAIFRAAVDAGAEGIISKRADSRYVSGRSAHWLKIKGDAREDVLVIGYMPSQKHELFASLLAAVERDGALTYVGRIGTGYDAKTRNALWPLLQASAGAPAPKLRNPELLPKGAVFLKRRPRAEVRFGGWTGDGQMRQARFIGLREDRPAEPAEERPMPRKTARPAPAATPDRPITITHADRVLFPDDGVTKGDVAHYYAEAAARMAPHLANRPVSLIRAPDGIAGEIFFQRHPLKGMARGIVPVRDPASGDVYMALDGATGLRTAAQFGAIEVHGWVSLLDDLDRPDRVIFDLDPDEALTFEDVKAGALDLRDHLSAVGVKSWPMVTGGKGVHVVAPLDSSLPIASVEAFAAGLARGMAQEKPQRYVASMSKARRKGRIFIDWLRNKRASTAVLPWSLRARPGAPAAVPLDWKGLAGLDRANRWTIRDALAQPDPWGPFFKTRQTIPAGALKLVAGIG